MRSVVPGRCHRRIRGLADVRAADPDDRDFDASAPQRATRNLTRGEAAYVSDRVALRGDILPGYDSASDKRSSARARLPDECSS